LRPKQKRLKKGSALHDATIKRKKKTPYFDSIGILVNLRTIIGIKILPKDFRRFWPVKTMPYVVF
jgi:hypothetical protein